MIEQALQGKVALVTGAGRGLGSYLAGRLAIEGCNLVICDINIDQLEEVKNLIQKEHGTTVLAFKADVTNEEEIGNMIDAAVEELSTIDYLVCNAALSFSGPIHDIPLSDWRRIVLPRWASRYEPAGYPSATLCLLRTVSSIWC